jgi:hypothetical protein
MSRNHRARWKNYEVHLPELFQALVSAQPRAADEDE